MIVVGARCAGSPLAALLARHGVRVVVVEQATFPRDTLSTHLLHAQALAFLDRLGAMEKIRATGAPIIGRFDTRQENLQYTTPIPQQSGDVGGFASVRRSLLDPILAQAAVEAGADLRMGSKVTALMEDQGRVTGVRVTQNGAQTTLRARLVIGADGRNSTVATLVGAMGKAGALDAVVPEIQSRLLAQDKIDILTNLFTHRSRPSEVFTPARLLGATGRLLARPGCRRRTLLREVGAIAAQDLRRRRLNRRPAYATAGTALDARPTEVQDSAAPMTIGAD